MKNRFVKMLLVMAVITIAITGCQKDTGTVNETAAESEAAGEITEEIEELSEESSEGAAEGDLEEHAAAEDEELAVMEDYPEEEMGDYPSNFLEERCNKTSFASYDEIIGLLEDGEGYAYVKIKGIDEDVLLITDEIVGDDHHYAVSATPYLISESGNYLAGSIFFSDCADTPLAVSKDGQMYCLCSDNISVECAGGNGTDIPAIMCMQYLYKSTDENGSDSYGGFVRTENTVIDNDGEQLEGDAAKAAYDKAFADYESCTKVDFTVVGSN